MTGSPLAMPMRIMHRWKQRMNGSEIAILFFAAAMALVWSRTWRPVIPLSAFPAVPGFSFWEDLTITFLDMLMVLLAVAVCSLFLMGLARLSKTFRAFLVPALSVGRATPGLGLIGLLTGLLPPLVAIILVAASGMVWRVVTAALDAEETVPADLERVAHSLHLTEWQRFWRLQMPLSLPMIVHRSASAMSGVWFRLLCAQAIVELMTHHDHGGAGTLALLGMMQHQPLWLFEAIGITFLLIVMVDQCLTRPLLGWSQRYRLDGPPTGHARNGSWILKIWRHSSFLSRASLLMRSTIGGVGNWRIGRICTPDVSHLQSERRSPPAILPVLAIMSFVAALWWGRILNVLLYDVLIGLLTLSHVCGALILSVVLWVPVGLLMGNASSALRRRVRTLSVLCALFPAVLLYPVFRIFGGLPPAVLLFLGTHWLVGVAVLDAAQGVPPELRQVVQGLRLQGPLLWRRVLLPLMAPNLCGGLLIAAMPMWNTVMIAEAFAHSGSGLGEQLLSDTLRQVVSAQIPALTLLVLLSMLLDRLVLQPLAVHAAQKYTLT
ncbi:ABC transporter permease subunit [Gluconobacter wancherniae]|uniref:ABC transporter permease subunit n=1 Tax=Gluconobacter wancherniae TaxID=1307955 RepID=UPI001B8B023C|nr:ABC transporter permease subunit [Gluconobacter wancherniae]MBS1089070.1 ABC transporter permease subunit [Gluconobacter wancherniae]